jgi:DNA-binding helix-hairpin-helix protein with protein kinase domain
MDKPPGTPPLSIAGDEVAFLFERAFAKQMVQGGRPAPSEWAQALFNLEKSLKQCRANPSHWHHKNTSCPWCPMEAATGVELFPFVQAAAVPNTIDLQTLWRQISALNSPGPAPSIQMVSPQPSAEAREIAGSFRRANIIAFAAALGIGAVAVFGGLNAPAPILLLLGALLSFYGARRWLDKSNEVYKLRDAKAKAESAWNQALKRWNDQCGSGSFDDKRQELMRLKQAIDYLPTLRNTKLDQLKKSVRQAQLARFLDTFEIDEAQLNGIGIGRKRTLASYGIETAADLLNPISVPGFGPVLRGTLMAWRLSLENRFVFNPHAGVDRRDINKVEQEILKERVKFEQSVRTAYGELIQLRTRILNARSQLKAPVEAAYRDYLQASVNYKTAGGA